MQTFIPEFHKGRHEYRAQGKAIPSVTQMIDFMRLTPPYPEDNGALGFGKACHKAAELEMDDFLDLEQTHPAIQPYIAGLREKRKEMSIQPLSQELRFFNRIYGYAGTLDLLALVYSGDLAICDYKTGNPPPCVELQLAGYTMGVRQLARDGDPRIPADIAKRINSGENIRRFSIQLIPHRAVVRECKDYALDDAAWVGVVALYKWKKLRNK
jgi:hypothetical protein